MSKPKVTLIDYGIGNLLSVRRALDHCGADVTLCSDARELAGADRLVLPGVGAFGDGMQGLAQLGMIEAIQEYAAKGRPLLGICLGMQMLMDASAEFGEHAGLGLIAGDVVPIPKQGVDGRLRKTPHMGWSDILPPAGGCWEGTLLNGITTGSSVYFVHSFHVRPDDESSNVGICEYDGISLPAVIAKDHILGCQFHPEKSAGVGLQILDNFLKV